MGQLWLLGLVIINNLMLTSTWLTVSMSFSRYLAVCHPLGVFQDIPLLADCTAPGVGGATRLKAGVIFVACLVFNLPRFFEYRIESHSCVLGAYGAEQTVFALNFGVTAGAHLLRTIFVWIYFSADQLN